MTLHERINEDMISAMKSRDRDVVDLLRVVKGEFGRVGKDLTDDQAIPVIRKMVENAKELGNESEVEILEKYLPEMLGEFQIKTIVGGIISKNKYSGMQDMGKVMSTIKNHPMSTQIDGKLASQITRDLLTQ